MTTTPIEPPAAPQLPRVWPVFVAYALAFGTVIIVGSVLVAAIAIYQGGLRGALDSEKMSALARSAGVMLLGATVSSSTLAATALIGARMGSEPLRQRLRIERANAGVLDVVLATIGALAIGEAFSCATRLAGFFQGSTLESMGAAVQRAPPLLYVPLLVVGSLGAGLGEELFFRGYMQTRLARRWGSAAGVAISAMAFGLMHLDPLHTPFALLFGVYLGWLAERRQSIVLPMIVHVLNNLTSFSLMKLDVAEPGTGFFIGLLAASLVIGGAAVFWLARR